MEILHGEGGDDAKHFARTLAEVYERYARQKGLDVEYLDSAFGHHVLRVRGVGAGLAFQGEQGKHCVQRVPPNDRSGRAQTSFVCVGVLPLPPERVSQNLAERDIEVVTQTGKQKAGGQNANKVASAVRMRHKPTGLSVFINGRDQIQNRKTALRILTAKVNDLANQQMWGDYAQAKEEQLGNRGRGGKVRTYNLMDGFVVDHRTGKRTSDVKGVLKGNLGVIR